MMWLVLFSGMILLGVDYGTKRMGVAASDDEARVAFSVGVVDAERGLKRQFGEIFGRHPAGLIVVGNPLDRHGMPTAMSERAERFAGKMSGWFEIECVMWDERYTSAMADNAVETFRQLGDRDQAAAVLILQSYLDYLKRT